MAAAVIRARSPDQIDAARDLVREFFDFLGVRYPDMIETIEQYRAVQDVEGQLARFDITFLPPAGECFLALADGEPMGIVLLKRHDAARGEVNRMYVRPEARRLGLGRALCEALIAEARGLGLSELVLDGLYRHVEAKPLYYSLGFQDYTDPAAFSADDPRVFHMRLDLAA